MNSHTTMAKRVAPLLAALLLAACAAPEFKQPKVDIPVAFKESQAIQTASDGTQWKQAASAEAQPRGEWWLAFNDTALNQLIADATRANANLAVAAARVKQARAIAGIAEADRIPQIGVNAGAQRNRSSALSLGLPNGTPVAPGMIYQANLTASYEVDLFGRVASNVSASQADAAAVEATYRSVLLSLQADVAQTYFNLRETDAELATLQETVRLREENVKVNQSRYDLGDIGEFDLARAKTELSTSRAEAIGLQRQRVTNEHALAVLLGKPAAEFTAGVSPLLDSNLLPVIPAGMPSTLLERRPDIAAAQRTMVASNARIGIAKSAMFPALSLNAAAGSATDTFSDIFKWSSRSWVLGALMSMPIIDGGRNKNNILRSEAALEESVASYRQSVLVAFAEVEDNLAGLRILAGQTRQIDEAVVSARRSADLAQKLYAAGRSSYLDLLDAQRNLAAIERNAVQLRGSRAVTTVALIRALGGGWGDQPAAAQASAQVASN
ncbi:efflux transporter outer membrane subunit [Janthinobacterium agaricidamnosum]|uniref:Efflux transporter, outer membrane factor (OMF) lipo, NodT family protein n=1 Tax=Janthinobacterium agaricidamnosum NBRC 102515 = DSM 9628 TaxID=1349767 RepID=W0V3Y5_9BURK|nr:efflux transporter outer membrane subunit [Janthinobacterium agaricidamnosum]CDG83539.1 efflux transporter, outer membrane factor (OMF) lipo, NodT family protein [Janthinobacterium agaricidamnosum NBRC 102515 = DSM 9628]